MIKAWRFYGTRMKSLKFKFKNIFGNCNNKFENTLNTTEK